MANHLLPANARLHQKETMTLAISRSLLAAALFLLPPAMACAGTYEFLAAPETDLNRVYRVDRLTGEVGACQYGLKDQVSKTDAQKNESPPDPAAQIGLTLCYKPGEGATAQPPSEYGLVASRHDREGGVFRVDLRNGAMSICYVLNEAVVCTPPAK